jgi:predicted dehydrogenase
MNTIHWGIIGCGDVTEVKSGPGFQKAEGSRLVAVMRRHGELAADYARRHGVPRWYDDAEALIADPEVDAVYVATPPAFHKAYTLLCARAGKLIYVEKPMALNHGECLEMLHVCEEASAPLFVAYYRRRLPRFLKVAQLIEAGAIGQVRSVRVTLYQRVPPEGYDPAQLPWRVVPAISGGGLFLDLGSHTLDLLDYLLGPIARVSGYATNRAGLYDAEDMVSAAFMFESGVQGVGSWCFAAAEDLDETVILGSEGAIRFATYADEPVRLATPHGGSVEFRIPNPPHVQQPLIQSVVDDLLGRGMCPSTGVSAARTSWVMDQVLQEYRDQHPARV